MTDLTHIVCPHCFAKNRIPTAKLANSPICGKCKTELVNIKPAELSGDTLAKYIRGNDQLVIIDFWASWCQPCIMMAPQFSQAASQLPQVRFAKLQTDQHEQASAAYGIRSLPTMVAFKNGQEIARQSGALSAGQIMQWVQSLN